MTWFAFKGYGVIDVAGIQEKNLVGWGFHGYSTQAQATAHPNSVNLLQKPLVDTAIADYKQAVKEKAQPGGPNASNPLAATLQASNLGGLNAIGDFFNRLTQPNTWLRIGEFAAGGLLIYMGLTAAMRGTDAQQATQSVTKPVKKAVDLAPPVRNAKIARSAGKRVARERKVTEKSKQIRAQDRARKKANT